jgi:hypothetical protein
MSRVEIAATRVSFSPLWERWHKLRIADERERRARKARDKIEGETRVGHLKWRLPMQWLAQSNSSKHFFY